MSSTENTVLELDRPKITLQASPIEGAEIGVPMHAVIIYQPENVFKRAQVIIDPPKSGTVDPNDNVRLWQTPDPKLVGPVIDADPTKPKPMLLDATTISDVNAKILMYIKESQFLTGAVVYLFYTIERGSSNIGVSLPQTYIYHRIRPGMKDDLTIPGGHSRLKLLLPEAIKNGVGPDFVSAQVAVEYPYCRAHDRITLACNGATLTVKVTTTEAPAPPHHGSETPTTIYFTVDRAFLESAKQEDHKLAFVFTVYDQFDNSADPDAQWSPPQIVNEDLDGKLLPMPILLERKEDYPGDDSSIIDLEKLAGNPLLLVVRTTDNRFVVGDDVIATYTAENTGEPGDVVVPVSGKVEEEVGQKKVLYLEVPNDKVFAGSNVTAYFDLRRPNGDLVGSSSPAKATVTDTAPIDLKPEITSVTDSLNNEIPHNGGTVDPQVTLTGTATQRQQVEIFEGAATKGNRPVDASGIWTYETTLTGIGTRTFTAKAKYGTGQISAGRTLTLSNALTPAIVSVQDSAGVEIPDHGFTSDTTVKLIGTATPRLEVEIFDGTVSVGKARVNGDTGKWEFEITELALTSHSFKAKALYAPGAESTPPRTLTVTAATAPTLTSVKGSPSDVEIPQGGITVETAVTLSGVAAEGQKVEIFDGTVSQGQAMAHATTGVWTLLVSGLTVAGHSFTAKALYGSEQISEERTFKVVTPLIMDTQAVTISSPAYHGINNLNPGSRMYDRVPKSGTPPYSYTKPGGYRTNVSTGVSVCSAKRNSDYYGN